MVPPVVDEESPKKVQPRCGSGFNLIHQRHSQFKHLPVFTRGLIKAPPLVEQPVNEQIRGLKLVGNQFQS